MKSKLLNYFQLSNFFNLENRKHFKKTVTKTLLDRKNVRFACVSTRIFISDNVTERKEGEEGRINLDIYLVRNSKPYSRQSGRILSDPVSRGGREGVRGGPSTSTSSSTATLSFVRTFPITTSFRSSRTRPSNNFIHLSLSTCSPSLLVPLIKSSLTTDSRKPLF